MGFPGGSVVKNLPATAGAFDPWSGKIPHAMEQLSLCATTIEPMPRDWQRSHYNEKSAQCDKELAPCSLQLEKRLHSNRDPA